MASGRQQKEARRRERSQEREKQEREARERSKEREARERSKRERIEVIVKYIGEVETL